MGVSRDFGLTALTMAFAVGHISVCHFNPADSLGHGVTGKQAPQGFAPIAIGLCITLIHLISIAATHTSVNPARSTAAALFTGGWAAQQLWLFWVAPIIGEMLGSLVYRWLGGNDQSPS